MLTPAPTDSGHAATTRQARTIAIPLTSKESAQ